MIRNAVIRSMAFASIMWLTTGCHWLGQSTEMKNNLDTMRTAGIQIQGHAFQVWLATTDEQQQRGLMQVRQEQLDPIAPNAALGLPLGADRGMLFVFSDEEPRAFWMYNTIIALDIAFIRSDGVIVMTHTMAPLETRLYPSVEPAQFALEVRAGLFAELGINPGMRVEMPESLLKSKS